MKLLITEKCEFTRMPIIRHLINFDWNSVINDILSVDVACESF